MPNETNETLSPEQFFEQHNIAGDYIIKEDFFKYCEQFQWISVEDRLPPAENECGESANVLFIMATNGVATTGWYEEPNNAWVTASYNSDNTHMKASHWMPIPKLPKP